MIPDKIPAHSYLLLSNEQIGMGVALHELNVLVCVEKTVRNFDEVHYENQHAKGKIPVLYLDEINNLAFCQLPESKGGYPLTTEANSGYWHGFHPQFKIQGEPVLTNGILAGIVSYPIIQEETINIIPADTIWKAYHEWNKSGYSKAIKCPGCNSIIENKENQLTCKQCKYPVRYFEKENNLSPILLRIEKIIANTGFKPEYTRRGSGIWFLQKEDITLEINYHERTGTFLAQSKIGTLNTSDDDETLIYLMQQNYHNKELGISLKGNNIYLMMTLFDNYMDDFATQKSLTKMLNFSKNYKEVLKRSDI